MNTAAMGQKKKILLVDDSLTMLAMLQALLGGGPYEILTARNGAEAIERAVTGLPDLILMDVVMPVMDGLEACQRLRAHEATRDIPIILVTTRGHPRQMALGLRSGCNDYLTKPIDEAELVFKVRSYLG